MPLVSILTELKKAQQGRYGLPCFDTMEMLGTQGIFQALEEKRAPAMVGVWTGIFDRPNPGAFVALVRSMAEDATVPVSLILDHGASFEHCIKALKAGFTDVMYDGSKLPVEENIETTRWIVRAAHAVGAAVEAELGHVGIGSQYQSFGAQGKGFTDPAMVERFVAETGVDFLAIAIGTAHGLYEGEPHIDLDLLREVRNRVDIPLVLHGGTGLSEQQFKAAVAGGISKINIFTDLAMSAGSRMIEAAKGDKPSYFGMTNQVREAFLDRCKWFIDVFGAAGKC
jgi:fructose-bisphosphate aldolase, class II